MIRVIIIIIIIITECHKQHLVQGLQGCTHGDTQRFSHAQSLKRASEQFSDDGNLITSGVGHSKSFRMSHLQGAAKIARSQSHCRSVLKVS